jgi:ABC-type sugar transport system ATPase subunit
MKASSLSHGDQRLLEIGISLAANPEMLLLDEPTSSLTEHEARNLFAILRRLRDSGRIIIFVSHKCEEVLALCDRVTVLRKGRVTASGIHPPETTMGGVGAA